MCVCARVRACVYVCVCVCVYVWGEGRGEGEGEGQLQSGIHARDAGVAKRRLILSSGVWLISVRATTGVPNEGSCRQQLCNKGCRCASPRSLRSRFHCGVTE